ncbi:MAG: nucleoside-diphosphate sugar epimerase/dehydratase [Candidatus Krumholzibacteria bacterium]|nr:nucleoside-diphosphate sugar epimerase/dehydratase [Candidatus Krumholzibacteria bacterium]
MKKEPRKKVLIVGAGEAGRMVASEIAAHLELESEVIGFIDDDPRLAGKKIMSLSVLGRVIDLEEVAERSGTDEVIIAVPSATGLFVRRIIKSCRRANVPFKIVPGVMEIIKGEVHIEQVREVRPEDLLGRESVELDLESAREILSGKTVLVTGAGGSIGSELCRQIARVNPRALVLLGRGENRIFDIEDELRSGDSRLNMETYISDLRDPERTMRIVKECAPDIIYHAAAHKPVHYMERDPAEAVINNVAGGINIIKAAEACGVSRFVFISSDKAANPRGVMGATKRLIELYLCARNEALSRTKRDFCRFITVRFGNVIGSTGSVIPLFLKQIRRGGPVTVSDPAATRYFMTVREAALLVIRASVIGKGGETFILDMGDALSILEMAQDLIILAGYEPNTEIPIVLSGLREGEKLHEHLVAPGEELVPLGEEKMFLARSSVPGREGFENNIEKLVASARKGRREEILEGLASLIPDFGVPSEDPNGSEERM